MPFTHFNDNNNGLTYLLVRGMMDSVTSYFVRCDVLRLHVRRRLGLTRRALKRSGPLSSGGRKTAGLFLLVSYLITILEL